MGEFFRGWKSMLGCVTLGITLAFAGGWVRSLTIEDELAVVLLERRHVIDSAFGKLQWLSWNPRTPSTSSEWNYEPIHRRVFFKLFEPGYAQNRILATKRLLVEIPNCCSHEANEDGVQTSLISYWSIVLPLSLISLWLLLSKPPQIDSKDNW